jgi:hypothetical protein
VLKALYLSSFNEVDSALLYFNIKADNPGHFAENHIAGNGETGIKTHTCPCQLALSTLLETPARFFYGLTEPSNQVPPDCHQYDISGEGCWEGQPAHAEGFLRWRLAGDQLLG